MYSTSYHNLKGYSNPKPEPTYSPIPEAEPEQLSTTHPEPEEYSTPKLEPKYSSTSEPGPEQYSTPHSAPEGYSTHKAEPIFSSTPEPEQEQYSTSHLEPEQYSTPKPEPKYSSIPEPKPERYPTPHSEPEGYSTPKPEPIFSSTPGPDRGQYSTPHPEPEGYSTPKPTSRYSLKPEPKSKWYSKLKPRNYTIPEPEPKMKITHKLGNYTSPEPERRWYPTPELRNHTMAEPEPKWYSTPEPEHYPKPKHEPEPEIDYAGKAWGEISPEPIPQFEIAREEWGAAWPLHYITLGILYTLIMLFILNSIIGLLCNRNKRKLQRRRFFLVINIMLFYMCLVMALSLFIDPYASGEYIKIIKFRGIIYLLLTLKYPCLTASFSLMQISLLEALKFTLYSTRLHSLRFIFGVIGVHFSIVLIGGLIMLSIKNSLIIINICHAFTLCLGFTISAMSIYSGIKILLHYQESEQASNYIALSTLSSNYDNNTNKKEPDKNISSTHEVLVDNGKNTTRVNRENVKVKKRTLVDAVTNIFKVTERTGRKNSVRRLAILLLLTALFGVIMCACIIFSLCAGKMNPWRWYIYQTLSNISEIGMVLTMAYVVRSNSNCCC